MLNTAYIALGSNLPFEGTEGPALLARVVAALKASGLRVLACSSVWRTAAWPANNGQPDYHNAVVEVDVGGRTPQALYDILCAIEAAHGRERREPWAARTLDLDIVAAEGVAGTFGSVILPHPRMHERAFVLAPLAEVAAAWRHPILGLTAPELLADIETEGYRRVSDLAKPD